MRRAWRLAAALLFVAASGCQLVLGIGGTNLDRDGGLDVADTGSTPDDRAAPHLGSDGDHGDALDTAARIEAAAAPDISPDGPDGATPDADADAQKDGPGTGATPDQKDGPTPDADAREGAPPTGTTPAQPDGPAPDAEADAGDGGTPTGATPDQKDGPPPDARDGGTPTGATPDQKDGPTPDADAREDAAISDADASPGVDPYFPLLGGTIASRLGGCLAVGEPVANAGGPKTSAAPPRGIVLAPCNDADPLQRWQRDVLGRFLAPHTRDGALTSSDQAATSTAARPVMLDLTADPPPSTQIWTLDGVAIVGVGALCLDVPNGDFSNGHQVQLYSCQSSDNQKWNVSPDGEIRHGTACLDVPNGTLSAGSPINTYQCNTSVVQRFAFQPGGTLGFGGLCAAAADPTAGISNRLLTIERCAPARSLTRAAQTFRVEGPLHLAGACLDAGRSGSSVSTAPCTGADSQSWIWRF